MEDESRDQDHGALLVAEIGLDDTYVTLVDLVDQSYRLVARASSPSTFAQPEHNPAGAIIAGLRQIEETTGRRLLHGDDLIWPQNDTGDGVDGMVTTTSAAGELSVAIVGLPKQAALRHVLQASRSTYTTLLDIVALDVTGTQLGQRVAALARQQPDVIVLVDDAGDDAPAARKRLAHVMRLLSHHTEKQARAIFVGDSSAAEAVREASGHALEIETAENVLPEPGQPRIEPVRSILRRHYRETVLPEFPGADQLKSLRNRRLGSVVEDRGLMIRYLAQRFGRNVLAVNVDSVTTSCQMASDGHYSEAIFGRLGMRLGALAVLQERGGEAIQRWLPFDIDGGTLHNRLLNRALRPYQMPTDLDDLLLDFALMREAVNAAYAALRDERSSAQFDLVVAGGYLTQAPRPGLAALTLLDALQPRSDDSELAINFYLDQFSLLAASGALAYIDADAAACLLEMDALNNGPLATVIVPRGELSPGKKVAEVELTPMHGAPLTRTVNAGDIVRLPLPKGKRATLRIRPVRGIAIGPNKPGSEVLSDEAAIVGSALGVIIDARPRPVVLPEDPGQRRATLLRWLDALDALPPQTAFASVGGKVAEASSSNGGVHGAADDVNGDGDAAGREEALVASGSDEVAALRDGLVLQSQPKRGFLRRK